MVHNALTYAKEGVFIRIDRWLKLILATLLLAIPMSGYILRIYRGAAPAPEVEQWGSLCLDGLKLVVISLIYAIPVIIVFLAPRLFLHASVKVPVGTVVHQGNLDVMGQGIGLILLMMVLAFILELVIAILLPIASIRFARTGEFFEAFNFGAILESIKKIGWLNYILALILIMIIIGIPIFILEMVFLFCGIMAGHLFYSLAAFFVVIIIIAPPLVVFQARYLTEVYDSRGPQGQVPSAI
jgi:hypothetical protein